MHYIRSRAFRISRTQGRTEPVHGYSIYIILCRKSEYRKRSCTLHLPPLRNADLPMPVHEVINNLFFSERRYDLGDVGRYRINRKLNLTTDMDVRVLTRKILSKLSNIIELINSKADVDDIDHLSNRRVRTVGEQLSNQFAIGLARMSYYPRI